jgi:hypothetical protein
MRQARNLPDASPPYREINRVSEELIDIFHACLTTSSITRGQPMVPNLDFMGV